MRERDLETKRNRGFFPPLFSFLFISTTSPLLHISPPNIYKLSESTTYMWHNNIRIHSYTPPQDGAKASYNPILLHMLLKVFSAKPLVKISAN